MNMIRATSGRVRAGLGMACAAAIALAGAGGLVGMAPEPDPVPRRWELTVDPGQLQLVTLDVPNVGARKFFYLTFQVTNNSGQDLLFAPSFELSDGDGNVAKSGRDVPAAVTRQIMERTQNAFMQDQIGVIGELMQGRENARDGVVIWPVGSLRPSRVTVYAAGFSGETKTVPSPSGKDSFVLRKTLQLDFQPPGDMSGMASKTLDTVGRAWIMR